MPGPAALFDVTYRLDRMLSSQGDGTGIIEQNVAGVSITAATTAAPVECTANAHPYASGDWVFIDGATGTTEINGLRQVVKTGANTFTLKDSGGTAIDSAGAFGGTVDSNYAFVVKPGATEAYDLVRINIAGGDASAWVVGGMLGVAALTNGIIVAVYGASGLIKTLTSTPIKGWHDWAMVAGSDMGTTIDITNNKLEAAVRWTFAKTSPAINIDGALGEMLVMYSQDDLDGLTFLQAGVQGTIS